MTGSAFISHFEGLTDEQLIHALRAADDIETYYPPVYFKDSGLATIRSIYIIDEIKRRDYLKKQKGV